MTITLKVYTISMLIVAAVSAAATRYYFPQTQEKTVTVTHDVDHNNIVTVTRTVRLPSGQVDTTTTTTDHSTRISSDVKQVEVSKQIDWHVHALFGTDVHKLQPIYGGAVERRIIGPIDVGVFGLTNGTIGVSLGLSF